MMELLGIQQFLTSPYYPQGNGITEQSHRTVGNMVWAQLAHSDDRKWVDVLPGIMLIYNEMEQKTMGIPLPKLCGVRTWICPLI